MRCHGLCGMGRNIIAGILFLIPLYHDSVFSHDTTEIYRVGSRTIGITFFSPVIVRVRVSASDSFSVRKSLSVVASPQRVAVIKRRVGEDVQLSSRMLSVILSLNNGAIRFEDHLGTSVLRAGEITSSSLTGDTVAGERVYHARQEFHLSHDEGVYGLGQFEDATMNYRGHDISLVQANRTAINPFLISTQGYGILWDNYSRSRFVDTVHDAHAHLIVSIWPAFGRQSALFQEMKEKGYLYPVAHWNGGLVYDAYNTEARALYWKYIKKGMVDIGIDGYWTDATEPEFRCTDDRFITELSMRQAGTNALGTFARYLNSYSLMTTKGLYEHHREATSAKRVFLLTRSSFAGQQRYGASTWSGDTYASWDNLKVQIASGINFSMAGIPYWNSDIGGFITGFHFPRGYDDPAYRELYVRWFQFGAFSPIFRAHGTNIPREIWRLGSRGDWAYDALIVADRLRYRLMPYIYSVAWKVTHDGYSFLRGLPMSFTGDKKTYSIADQFLFGPAMMVRPVTCPLRYEPEYRGIDITPEHFLSPDGEKNGAVLSIYRGLSFEKPLLTRRIDVGQIAWFGCIPAELDTVYSVRITGQLKSDTSGLHIFYIKTDGGVRMWINDTLLIDQWDNREERTLSAAYLLTSRRGCRFTIEHRQFKPQTANFKMNWIKPDAPSFADKNIGVYLPAHIRWYDFWSGDIFMGGQTIQISPPPDRIPLYVPAGSIIPVGPDIQYAMQKTDEPVELRIYPGRDAQFTLYDDEGDSYDYEKGVCSQVPIHWDDHKKTLTLGARKGSYPGVPLERTFHIVVVRSGHGSGLESTENPDRIITYRRKAMTVTFR